MQLIRNLINNIPRHLIVAASAWISRIITALISIISIRTLLSYLGEERYAVYAIVYSLSLWFYLSECGLGSSLQNYISECRSKNEDYGKFLQATLQIIAVLFSVFLILILVLSPIIQPVLLNKYMHISEISNINIVGIIGAVFIATAMVNIVYKIFYAQQKGYISNILPALSMIVSMFVIVLINKYSPVRASILLALLAFTVPQFIIALIPFIKIFKGYFKNLFDINIEIIKKLFIRAIKFAGYSIMTVLTLHIDYIIMSQTVSPIEITQYNIFNKIFLLLLFINSAIIFAAWPVYTELFHKKEYNTVKNMIKKNLIFGFAIIIIGTLLIYLFSDIILAIIAPDISIKPSLIFLVLFALLFLFRVWSDSFTVFLQSISVLRIFWIYLPFQAIISLICQYYFSLKYGINGILIGLIISFAFTSFFILPYKTWKVFKQYRGEE